MKKNFYWWTSVFNSRCLANLEFESKEKLVLWNVGLKSTSKFLADFKLMKDFLPRDFGFEFKLPRELKAYKRTTCFTAGLWAFQFQVSGYRLSQQ